MTEKQNSAQNKENIRESQRADREARVAEALRANLRRRKAQAKSRKADYSGDK